jgi:hypothetical protein
MLSRERTDRIQSRAGIGDGRDGRDDGYAHGAAART